MPVGLPVSADDRRWLGTHWGVDIGAADVTRHLSQAFDAPAILGVASRLVLDLNRAPDDPTLVLTSVEGHRLGFNQDLDEAERAARIAAIHTPYHHGVDTLANRLAGGGPVLLFSVHSFTPEYLGTRRDVEMGVLFDEYPGLAQAFMDELCTLGWDARLNEPWSGLEGLIYAANRHGRAQACPYLEIEIRQDLIGTPALAEAMAARLMEPLKAVVARLG